MGGIPDETDGALLARMGTDAAVWARELAERLATVHTGPGPYEIKPDPAPGALLHVWLCNAIEAGRSAGYAQGRMHAERDVLQLIGQLDDGKARPIASTVVADLLRNRLTGWPLPADSAGRPPADLAGRTQPADFAGRTQPADFAGRDRFCGQAQPHSAHGGCSGYTGRDAVLVKDGKRVDLNAARRVREEVAVAGSDVSRAADALEGILETLRGVVKPADKGGPGRSFPAVRTTQVRNES